MNKDHGKKIFAIIEIREVLIFLYEDLVIKDYFYFVEAFQYVVALFLPKCPVSYETVTIF